MSETGRDSRDDTGELAAARAQILHATLSHVTFDGWSEAALEAGIRDAGVSDAAGALAFQGGLAELAEYYAAAADIRMCRAAEAAGLAELSMRDRIAALVWLRFTQASGEREAIRALMVWLALPGNQALAAKCLARTVDEIWHAAGDRATDFSFYSRRATLAAVLGAVTLYWLTDESEDFADTRAFLDRRMADVMQVEMAKARLRDCVGRFPDPFRILRGFGQGFERGRRPSGGTPS